MKKQRSANRAIATRPRNCVSSDATPTALVDVAPRRQSGRVGLMETECTLTREQYLAWIEKRREVTA